MTNGKGGRMDRPFTLTLNPPGSAESRGYFFSSVAGVVVAVGAAGGVTCVDCEVP